MATKEFYMEELVPFIGEDGKDEPDPKPEPEVRPLPPEVTPQPQKDSPEIPWPEIVPSPSPEIQPEKKMRL